MSEGSPNHYIEYFNFFSIRLMNFHHLHLFYSVTQKHEKFQHFIPGLTHLE
jgi:hypothetical protein